MLFLHNLMSHFVTSQEYLILDVISWHQDILVIMIIFREVKKFDLTKCFCTACESHLWGFFISRLIIFHSFQIPFTLSIIYNIVVEKIDLDFSVLMSQNLTLKNLYYFPLLIYFNKSIIKLLK